MITIIIRYNIHRMQGMSPVGVRNLNDTLKTSTNIACKS
jgi:hypothetical protein